MTVFEPSIVQYEDITSDREETFVRAATVIGDSLLTTGFFTAANADFPADDLSELYAQSLPVFALPTDVKMKYERAEDGRQNGYNRFGLEHAKNRPDQPDLKEHWMLGRDVPPEHRFYKDYACPVVFPDDEVPGFRPAFMRMFEHERRIGTAILRAVSYYLVGDPEWLPSLAKDGNHRSRVIYSCLTGEEPEDAMLAGDHEDINLLTVLPAAKDPSPHQPCLQILRPDGVWVPYNAPARSIICDTGDMMKRLIEEHGFDKKLPSTTHRVVKPRTRDGHLIIGQPRLSNPFFLHLAPDYRFPRTGITSTEFLMERLRENGMLD